MEGLKLSSQLARYFTSLLEKVFELTMVHWVFGERREARKPIQKILFPGTRSSSLDRQMIIIMGYIADNMF